MIFLKIKKKNNLDQFLTYKKANLGPVSNFTAYIYIYMYIYICAVELKAGPRFGVSSVKNWSKSSVKNWSKSFFTVFLIFVVFWGYF